MVEDLFIVGNWFHMWAIVHVHAKRSCNNNNNNNNNNNDKGIWKLPRVTVVPIIIGALGTVSKNIEKWLAEIGVTCHLESLQRACLLDTARILRKVFDT